MIPRNNKWLVSLLVAACCWFNIAAVYAGVQSDPVALLRYVADNMIKGLKENQATLKSKPQIVYNLAYKYVVPNANLSEMAKRVVPPQTWNSATPAQRAQFQKQFTQTLIRTYASSLTSYKDQTVQFFPVRGGYQGRKTVEVNSEITSSENPTIQVTYRMVNQGGTWRLFDLSVEGVSMLESFRAQFADILSRGNMEQLLQRMSNHNSR